MEYKAFKDIKLSRLGMGNMRLPVHRDREGMPIDYEKAQEIIDSAIQNGVNYFDTAYVYHGGESEKFLGTALSRYPRGSYYLATKYIISASKDYRAVFEEQLERLKTDYIDFYLIHAVFDGNCQEYLNCGCIEYFAAQQKKGRIRYLGFSSHANPLNLEKFASYRSWDFAQIQLNYFDWKFGTAKQEYELLERHGIPVMVMEPVRGGRLATLSADAAEILKSVHPDWSVPSWAFRFVKGLPSVQVVLSGMSSMKQLDDNISTFSDGSELSADDTERLMTACEVFRNQVRVPCTGCRYCCDGCPARINIPAVLGVYNRFKTDGGFALADMSDIDSVGKPQDCTGCTACKTHCPQNIDITAIMEELRGLL